MAFSEPTIHHVEKIDAAMSSDPTWNHCSLLLWFTQGHKFPHDEKRPAHLEIYGDASMHTQFQEIADAINAVFADMATQKEEA